MESLSVVAAERLLAGEADGVGRVRVWDVELALVPLGAWLAHLLADLDRHGAREGVKRCVGEAVVVEQLHGQISGREASVALADAGGIGVGREWGEQGQVAFHARSLAWNMLMVQVEPEVMDYIVVGDDSSPT
ncbi:MAG: hypothetical protein JNK47_14105 [Mesorhizobium sp.]|nr:hypothetical protein [Mesorhizobium sp.]MBL8578353.1 hypothetical protein [Mesorhizobium sp.]